MTEQAPIRGWLPPEWAPQGAVMLTWPHESSDWWRWLEQVDRSFAVIAREVTIREHLLVTCRDAAHEQRIRAAIGAAGGDPDAPCYYQAPADDAWVRDHGPVTILHDGEPLLLDFVFNGWGNKYDAARDNQLTRRLHAQGAFGNTPLRSVQFVLEGGSIETDGEGTLMTTASCLLSPNRNPGWNAPQMEAFFRNAFGVQRVVWLEHGALAGDDTDGHIDTLARFCDPATIAFQACDDESDEHFATLEAMRGELEALRTIAGERYRLVPLPLPGAKYDEDGRRLPASYANFLVINGAVLVPVYDDPSDQLALEQLQECFPGRVVIPVNGLPIIHQYGSVHCVTMQLPAGVEK